MKASNLVVGSCFSLYGANHKTVFRVLAIKEGSAFYGFTESRLIDAIDDHGNVYRSLPFDKDQDVIFRLART